MGINSVVFVRIVCVRFLPNICGDCRECSTSHACSVLQLICPPLQMHTIRIVSIHQLYGAQNTFDTHGRYCNALCNFIVISCSNESEKCPHSILHTFCAYHCGGRWLFYATFEAIQISSILFLTLLDFLLLWLEITINSVSGVSGLHSIWTLVEHRKRKNQYSRPKWIDAKKFSFCSV